MCKNSNNIINSVKGRYVNMEKLNIGIVGVGGRPAAFLRAIEISDKARLAAVCDLNRDAAEVAVKDIDNVEIYTDYEEMLEKAKLDAVVIGTPIPLHVQQSIAALKRNIHVFCEVTAAKNLAEARQLVEACRSSRAQYMMGENSNYHHFNMIVAEMVKNGLFGNVFYAEADYIHDCRDLWVKTPWRRKTKDSKGVTYGTHSLGPVLTWFRDDRVVSVCCAGSGRHNFDLDGSPAEWEDHWIMLCKTAKNRLIKISTNFSSPHPFTHFYYLQGTNAAFRAERAGGNFLNARICIPGISKEEKWDELSRYEDQYMPEIWKKYGEKARGGGHGGSDTIIMLDFIDAIYDGRPVPIDIHASLDMTLPGIYSVISAQQGGVWVEVDDSRKW
jgi:predicted dehydrogenase